MSYLALSRCVLPLQFTEWRTTPPPVAEVHSSIEDFEAGEAWDLVFTKGVLIHLKAESLPAVYEKFTKIRARIVMAGLVS